ncbi:DNA gyrase C-terminal beta-propeller domain-containing protein, partial [Brevibacterium salitolerans]
GTVDELVSARLVNSDDHLLLISRGGMSIRFSASDEEIRATGRATSGVTGMRFRDDELLTMDTVTPGTYVFVVTEGGYAKRTPIEEYRLQGRGGMGIKVAKITEERGVLVGGLIVSEGEEVLVVMERGKVVRSSIDEVPAKGRNTMGVVFAKPGKKDRIIAVTRGPEEAVEAEAEDAPAAEASDPGDRVPEEPEVETEGEEQQ